VLQLHALNYLNNGQNNHHHLDSFIS